MVGLEINVEKNKSRHRNAGQNRHLKNSKQIIWKCVKVQIFGNDSMMSKFDSGGNLEETDFW
jgi:hypothetical protein